MKFNMNTVWSDAIELVRENFQLLAVIAAIFLLLPSLAAYLLVPDFQNFIDPTVDQEVLAQQMLDMIGPLIGLVAIAMIFQFTGYGAMIALIGDNRPTVGQALTMGIKIVPSTFAIMILFVIAYMIGAFIITLPVALVAGILGAPALTVIAIFVILIFVVWLMTRMSLSLPVLILEDTLNPITAVLRSFKLTGPNQWAILLFWFVLGVVYMVIALLLTGVFSVIAALMGSGVIAMAILGLANGAIGMVVGMVICAISVSMYSQLAGPSTSVIEDTFE